MADTTNSPTGREISLSYKRSTEGLSPEEETELKQLQVARKLKAAGFNPPSDAG